MSFFQGPKHKSNRVVSSFICLEVSQVYMYIVEYFLMVYIKYMHYTYYCM